MPTLKKRVDFFNSQEGVTTETVLRSMVNDTAYSTEPSYSTNSGLYPDNLIPFVDKHMNYLLHHPATETGHYLANLRLMTRLK